jgi:hypothetical protein
MRAPIALLLSINRRKVSLSTFTSRALSQRRARRVAVVPSNEPKKTELQQAIRFDRVLIVKFVAR